MSGKDSESLRLGKQSTNVNWVMDVECWVLGEMNQESYGQKRRVSVTDTQSKLTLNLIP